MVPAAPRVSVIIPNWNGLHLLPECLDALLAQQFREFEAVVVDNGSADGSAEWLAERYPMVRVIRRPDNGGFSRAVNDGIRATRGEYVALLNNDAVPEPSWLGALVAALDARPGYAFAASKLILYDRPTRLNAVGDVYLITRLVGKARGYNEPVDRYSRPERVLGACAAAVLYRRSLFARVGLFDEDFFLMSEDTDLNLRCLIAGLRCLYVPDARVRHKGQASSVTKPREAILRLARRNEAMVAAKDLPVAALLLGSSIQAWGAFRDTFPVRPSKWHLVPSLVRRTSKSRRGQLEGFRRGLAKRPDVWRRRAVGMPEIVRWLVKGWGPA